MIATICKQSVLDVVVVALCRRLFNYAVMSERTAVLIVHLCLMLHAEQLPPQHVKAERAIIWQLTSLLRYTGTVRVRVCVCAWMHVGVAYIWKQWLHSRKIYLSYCYCFCFLLTSVSALHIPLSFYTGIRILIRRIRSYNHSAVSTLIYVCMYA